MNPHHITLKTLFENLTTEKQEWLLRAGEQARQYNLSREAGGSNKAPASNS